MAHPIYKACILKGWEGIMMRKQAEKDYRSETPADEVDFKKNLRQRAVDAANDKRFFQNASVRKFNSDLLKEKIRKDNAAMAASKRETERKADQQRREKEEEMRQKCIDAQRKEEDESRKRRRDKLALKDELVKKTKEKKLSREKERQQEKVERDQLRALDEQHQQELRHEERKELEAKDKKAKLHKEEIYRKNCLRQKEIEKLNMKEKETKRVQTDREEVLQQRKQKKSEQFNKRQIPKDIVIEKLADAKKQQAAEKIQREKVKLSKDVAEAEAKVIKRQKDVKEKRAAALKSIATQRVEKHHENEQKEREEKEGSLDLLNQMKQCDRLSEEQNKLEVYFKRQNNIKHKVALISAAAEKQALLQQEIREEIHAAREMEKQIAEGEKAIQQYMQQVGEHLPAAERHRVLLNKEVPDYVCRDTGEPLLKRAPDPTHLMKRYREHDSLKQAMVDVRPHFLPPLSRAGDACHGSKDAGELLPTKVNSGWQRTPSPEEKIKQYLDMDKFQLNESSTADQRQTRFPTIYKKNSKENLQRTLLPTIHKKNSEGNLQRTLLPTIYKKNSEKNLQRTLLPTIYKKNSEENLQRTLLPTIYKKNSEENLQRTLLPTIYKKISEKNLQRTLLPTIYKKISEKNSTLLPTISTKNTPAVRIRSPQVVLQAQMTVTGTPLLRFATEQTKMIKRKQEQLTLTGRN